MADTTMRYRSAALCVSALISVTACGGAVTPDTGSERAAGAAATSESDPTQSTPVASDPVSSPGGGSDPASPVTPPAAPASPAPFPWVASCPAAPADEWTPAAPPTGTLDDLRAHANAVRASFAGHWTGKQSIFGTTPTVAFSFDASGHYSGICLGTQCWATIYNGTDNESPAKKYRLDDMSLDGVSSGTIDLAFPPQPIMGEDPSDPPYVPAVGTTVLKNVVLDASGNRLRFELVSYMHSPPYVAKYDLYRCP